MKHDRPIITAPFPAVTKAKGVPYLAALAPFAVPRPEAATLKAALLANGPDQRLLRCTLSDENGEWYTTGNIDIFWRLWAIFYKNIYHVHFDF